jgi:hypothetical protein
LSGRALVSELERILPRPVIVTTIRLYAQAQLDLLCGGTA